MPARVLLCVTLLTFAPLALATTDSETKPYVGSGVAGQNCDDRLSRAIQNDFPQTPDTSPFVPENVAGVCFPTYGAHSLRLEVRDLTERPIAALGVFYAADDSTTGNGSVCGSGTIPIPAGSERVVLGMLDAALGQMYCFPTLAGQPTTGTVSATRLW